MIAGIKYKGLLIGDTSIPGEQKKDGLTFGLVSCVQASERRWLLLDSTLAKGWDADKSIFCQLRADAPDGPLVMEKLISRGGPGWVPAGSNRTYWKCQGKPMLFGVPKGAREQGRLLPNHNLFVAKWYFYAHVEIDGKIIGPWEKSWPTGLAPVPIRVEWMQFRLNAAEDDIEIIAPVSTLCQKGYENQKAFCALGPDCERMNHALGGAVPLNSAWTEWVECAEFGFTRSSQKSGGIAAVRYVFNPRSGLYEWEQTGTLMPNSGSEACINRIDDSWIVSLRHTPPSGARSTAWHRTADLFAGFNQPVLMPCGSGPRTSFVCRDGVLRLFGHDDNNPYHAATGDYRNPLYCWDVDPETFQYANRQAVIDSRREGLAFDSPMMDHALLFPAQGNRQLIACRGITNQQTHYMEPGPNRPPLSPLEHSQSGSHYAELIYDKNCQHQWDF